jgi:hypothetical protein
MLGRKKKAKDSRDTGRTYFQLTLPLAHLQILSSEADHWGVGRGDFLTMLLRRKFGELRFERPYHASNPKLTDERLLKTERYAWYLPERDVPKLQADCLRLGNITFSTWVLMALNDWVEDKPASGEKELPSYSLKQVRTTCVPDEDEPAEPFWGVFAVDPKGRATGGMWAIGDREILLFRFDHVAEKFAKSLFPPSIIEGEDSAVAWSVRGISTDSLRDLQKGYRLRTLPDTMVRDRALLAEIKKAQATPL